VIHVHIYYRNLVDVAYAGRVVPHATRTSARAGIARSAKWAGNQNIYVCMSILRYVIICYAQSYFECSIVENLKSHSVS
jgi:hypothetical protein